jgi:regulator of protease activity HflC (stomatin/prohibitin superfamily)
MGLIYFLVLVGIFYAAVSIRVLRQYERGVVFLLGKFESVRGPGLTLIFVPFQQMVRVALRTVTMQIPSQKIITRDNVSIDIAAVAYYHITDPERAVIAIEIGYGVGMGWRKTRAIWLALVLGMHLGVGLCIGMWLFAIIMMILSAAAFAGHGKVECG